MATTAVQPVIRIAASVSPDAANNVLVTATAAAKKNRTVAGPRLLGVRAQPRPGFTRRGRYTAAITRSTHGRLKTGASASEPAADATAAIAVKMAMLRTRPNLVAGATVFIGSPTFYERHLTITGYTGASAITFWSARQRPLLCAFFAMSSAPATPIPHAHAAGPQAAAMIAAAVA
jgi:hypothetical protein